MIRKYLVFFVLTVFFVCSCATQRAAFKPGYKISKIENIMLGDFTGFGAYENSGEMVRDEFARQLIRRGFNVTVSSSGADAVLSATVTQFAPERKFLFYAPPVREGQKQVTVVPPLEIGGSNVYSLGSALGAEGSRILISNASVGISARIVDPHTSEIVWTDSYTYEGFDITGAVESAIRYLIKSLSGDK